MHWEKSVPNSPVSHSGDSGCYHLTAMNRATQEPFMLEPTRRYDTERWQTV